MATVVQPLGVRLKGDAAEWWYGDRAHEVSTLKRIAHIACVLTEVSCFSVTTTGALKKELSIFVSVDKLGILAPSRVRAFLVGKFAAAGAVLGAVEVFAKLPALFSPLRQKTIHVTEVDIGQIAPNASSMERIAKKVAQVADLAMSGIETATMAIDSGFVAVSPVFSKVIFPVLCNRIRTVAGFILTHGLYQECMRLYTGKKVEADPKMVYRVISQPASGKVSEMKMEDYVHSYIKVAMSLAYLAIAILSALQWAGCLIPGVGTAILVCTIIGNVAWLASYAWEKVCIENPKRPVAQPPVVHIPLDAVPA